MNQQAPRLVLDPDGTAGIPGAARVRPVRKAAALVVIKPAARHA